MNPSFAASFAAVCAPSLLRRILLVAGLALAVFTVLTPSRAEAYPQWQFTSGTSRCSQCHFSPGGGGLLKEYGRDATAWDLSTWEGDPTFLHGAVELPEWLQLQGDLRIAAVTRDNGGPDAPEQAVFPMQIETHGRASFGDFSVQAIIGGRAQVRDESVGVPDSNFAPANELQIVSREHFVMWQPSSKGAYARAGRFFAPFGLRFAEHILTSRRDNGFNILRESYALSGGWIEGLWELHLTAFAPDFLQSVGGQESGAAVYYERRMLDETLALAPQARLAFGDGYSQAIAGVVAKYYIESASLMLLTELNGIQEMPDGADGGMGLSATFGLTYLPIQGILVTALAERRQTDLSVADSNVDAYTGLLSWFPYPHYEIQAAYRLDVAAGQDAVPTLLLQFHYYL